MPTNIVRAVKAMDTETMKRIGVNVCMECGSCAYSCPAGKHLVQYMRLAKAMLREEAAKK
jgi:electron transport complex protein RnfC